MRSYRILRLAMATTILIAGVAACGGTNASFITNPSPAPATIATSATVMASSNASVALPEIGASGIDVAGVLPAASIAASLTESISVAAPPGTSAFAEQPIAYVSFSSTSSLTLSAVPALMFTLPSVTAGAYYYLALDPAGTWQAPVSGPATLIGNTAGFAIAPGSIAIAPTQPAVFALYETSTPPAVLTSPAVLAFNASDPAPQTFTVSENGYAGAFTSHSNCGAIAQVTPPTLTPTAAGGTVSFTVTPGADTGSCTIAIDDANSQTATVSVTVVLDQIIIYGHQRRGGAPQ